MKIAIHAHVFYPYLWKELELCIFNIINVAGYDNVFLMITVTDGNTEALAVVSQVKFKCKYVIKTVPNQGYDVGPFVCSFLNVIDLEQFDLIVKIHTKRDVDTWANFLPLKGNQWRRFLLSFCSTPKAFRRVIKAFTQYPRLGFISHNRLINHCGSDLSDVLPGGWKLVKNDFKLYPKRPVTIGGTMFAARSFLFKDFVNRYKWDDFIQSDGSSGRRNYGLAADLEFAFTLVAEAKGFTVSSGTFPPSIAEFGYGIQSACFLSLRKLSYLLRGKN